MDAHRLSDDQSPRSGSSVAERHRRGRRPGQRRVRAERDEHEARQVGAERAQVLEPAAGAEADDVEPDREPERAQRGGKDVAPVALQPGAAPAE